MTSYIVKYNVCGEIRQAVRQTLQEAVALMLLIDAKPCCDVLSLVLNYKPIEPLILND